MSAGQFELVRDFLSDGAWHSLEEITKAVGGTPTAVSARIRDLRQRKYGRYTINRRPVKGRKNAFEWQMPQGQTTDFSGADDSQEDEAPEPEQYSVYVPADPSALALPKDIINDTRRWIRKELFDKKNGAVCPCCNHKLRPDYRNFSASSFAYPLVLLATHFSTKPFTSDDVRALDKTLVDKRRDWTRLKLWELLEEVGPRVYRFTPKGLDVALAGASVPKTVHLYNGNVWSVSQEQVTVEDVLGTTVYRKLLSKNVAA